MQWTEYLGQPLLLNSYVEALTPHVTVFRDGAFMEVIKVKWNSKGEVLVQLD